jgi:hypothetical protein
MSNMFDRLAKMAAGGISRRDALKYLGGLTAGAFLGGFVNPSRADHKNDKDRDDKDRDDFNEDIEETCKKYCSKCPKGGGDGDDGEDEGVHGKCIHHCKNFLRKNPTAKPCGTCTAKTPFTACTSKNPDCCTSKTSNYCTNTNTDVKNCGKCGNACNLNTKLQGCCSGVCTDLTTDTNCGSCGNKCASGKSCKATNGKYACG